MVVNTLIGVIHWQRALKTVVWKLIEDEILDQELDIEFVGPRECEGVGNITEGNVYF